MKIDRNMKGIITILNRYPGIETTGCCGGHKNPKVTSQKKENQFYVSLEICNENEELPSREGWCSLGKISQAIMNCLVKSPKNSKLDITFCNLAPEEADPDGIYNSIEIHGENVDRELFRIKLEERYWKAKF